MQLATIPKNVPNNLNNFGTVNIYEKNKSSLNVKFDVLPIVMKMS